MAQTLSEQLSGFNLTATELEHLRKAGALLIPELDGVLARFYDRALKHPDSARFFSDQTVINHARQRQKEHWERLLSGRLDDAYEASVDRIGRVHARINLPLEQYMSAYAIASSDLFSILLRKLNRGLWRDNTRITNIATAMTRAFAFDIERVTSITFRVWSEEQEIALSHLDGAIEAMAQGDLTQRIPAPEESNFPDRFSDLRLKMNGSIDRLQKMLGDTMHVTSELMSVVSQITDSSDQLSQRTNAQAASLEETAAAMEEIVQSVRASSDNISTVNSVAGTAQDRVLESVSVVQQTKDAMARIQDASDKIGQITSLIDDIAFQTNLLALNAGVEAARAGEAGRGFAVVASEVRNLAGNSSNAAKEIKDLIAASATQVEDGARLVGDAGNTLDATSRNFEELSKLAAEIATAATQQSQTISEVNASITQLDSITQNNANMVEETNSFMIQMRENAERIHGLLSGFNLGDRRDAEPYDVRDVPFVRRANRAAA